MKIKNLRSMIIFFTNILNWITDFFIWDPYFRKSYSQDGEDMVVRKIFKKQKKGFYIDIGAHHPKRFSNTFLLYKRGWSGINIDAKPGSMTLFNIHRSRDINLEVGVGSNEGYFDFYIFNEPALNSFSKPLSLDRHNDTSKNLIKEIKKVNVNSLSKILDKNLKKNDIDLLNLDVEGLDLDVLTSNDWEKYRPKFIIVEILNASLNDLDKHPIVIFMREQNYDIFSKLVNTVFFKDDKINYPDLI